VESVAAQRLRPDSIVIAVDHAPDLHHRLVRHFAGIRVVENRFERGASGNRNSGAAETKSPLIAFLDDDAQAHPDWLSRLVHPFSDPMVVGTGGFVVPAWASRRPRWFPEEFAWVVGASHLGLPTTQTPVRNVWSENMAVRRDVFEQVGGFRLDFGKVGYVSRPEDTDLCIRMGKSRQGGIWIFVPTAVVDHHVGIERTDIRYFLKRCYNEGRGKVELAHINDGRIDLPDERHYLRKTIPNGFVRNVRLAMSEGELDGIYRAGAIAGGIGAAGAGALASLIGNTGIRLSSHLSSARN
jgi:GT2 family glycosyltransferase